MRRTTFRSLTFTLWVALTLAAAPKAARAQVYAGGAWSAAVNVGDTPTATTTTSRTNAVSGFVGMRMNSVLGIQGEVSVSGTATNRTSESHLSSQSEYVTEHRPTYVSGLFNLRLAPSLHAVAGISYRRESLRVVATSINLVGSTTGTGPTTTAIIPVPTLSGAAVTLGVDFPVRIASRVSLLPTFRMHLPNNRASDTANPYYPAPAGPIDLRFGVGGVVGF